MNRDPLWRSIEQALRGPLDPHLFERCMQDLLRDVYPGLAPVVGGSDAGMDGAIPSPEGPYPLICTTGEDVLSNFRRSIAQHLKRRGGPRRCVIATSQALTAPRREKIADAARDLDIRIDQIHDFHDVVGRLYRDPAWRRELLGVTGEPPALSAVPPRFRPGNPALLIGRDADLAWLRERATDDVVLVGQPGSGKTHLHRHLAEAGECLFLADPDPGRLADAVRAQQPPVIVVDDAHVRPGWVDQLVRLRHELGAAYAIHVNCWPGHERPLLDRLQAGPDATRRLRRLTVDAMAELIHALGVGGPDLLLHVLHDQAQGRPGLCAALVAACKRDGSIRRAWSGEALADALLSGGGVERDRTDREALARLALGGSRGVRPEPVAAAMGLSLPALAERMAALGAGGVIRQRRDGHLSVEPEALRPVLVRDVFYDGFVRPDIAGAVDAVPDWDACTRVLLDARVRGADVDLGWLQARVSRSPDEDLWRHFGWAGEDAAGVILDRHPDRLIVAAPGLLSLLPDATLDAVIRAGGDDPAGSVLRRDVREAIKTWVNRWDELANTGQKRESLLSAVERAAHAQPRVDAEAICPLLGVALDPYVSVTRPMPGSDAHLQHSSGYFDLDILQAIAGLWERALAVLGRFPEHPWDGLLEAVLNWAFPARGNVAADDDRHPLMRGTATRMLTDLARLPGAGRPLRLWAASRARDAGLDVTAELEPDFAVVFDDDRGDEPYEERVRRRVSQLDDVASRLAARGRAAAADWLGEAEREAARFPAMGGGWDRGGLYAWLARHADDPSGWMDDLASRGVPARFLAAFLPAVRERQPALFDGAVRRLFDRPAYRELAVSLILTDEAAAADLLERTLAEMGPGDRDGELRPPAGAIPVPTMLRLLAHPHRSIRATAALSEWETRPNHQVRAGLAEAWRAAILCVDGSDGRGHAELFRSDPQLAADWLEGRLRRAERWFPADPNAAMFAAAEALTAAGRRQVLGSIDRPERLDDEVFDAVVAGDRELYREWYRSCPDERLRVSTLRRWPDAVWHDRAAVAMDEGTSIGDLCGMVGGWLHSWSGSIVEYYRSLLPPYERMTAHADARFHPIGRAGLLWARGEMERAAGREAEFELPE